MQIYLQLRLKHWVDSETVNRRSYWFEAVVQHKNSKFPSHRRSLWLMVFVAVTDRWDCLVASFSSIDFGASMIFSVFGSTKWTEKTFPSLISDVVINSREPEMIF